MNENIKEAYKQFKKDLKKGLISNSAFENVLKDCVNGKIPKESKKIKEKEKITVIIPTHNRLEQVKYCINSILNQTYDNIEIIIIDDVSTDITQEYFKNNRNKKIKYIRNDKNLGMGLNRQKGFKIATGDFIVFCDDDDYYIDNEYFEKAIEIFKDDEINIICSESYIHYENINKYEHYTLNCTKKIKSLEYLKKFQFEIKKPTSTFPGMFRKSALDEAGFKDMKMMNDSSIYLRCLMIGKYTYFFKKIIGVYRVHEKNDTFNVKSDFTIKNLQEKKYVYKYLKKQKATFNLDEWYEKEIEITVCHFLNGKEKSQFKRNKVLNWVKINVSKKLYNKLKKAYELKDIKSNKNHTLDVLKAICTILIVFNHCVFPGVFGEILKGISRIAVPIFFMISGYYVYQNKENKILKKSKRILSFLLFGCLFWFVFNVVRYGSFDVIALKYYLLKFIDVKVIINFILFNVNPFWGHLWFLGALFYCYIFQYILKKSNYENKKTECISAVILLLAYFILNIIIVDEKFNNIDYIRNFIFVGIPFFLIGKNIHRTDFQNKISIRKLSVALLFTTIMFFVEYKLYVSELYISTIFMAIILFLCCLKRPNFKLNRVEFFGANLALYCYIIHPAIKYCVIDVLNYLQINQKIINWIYPIITILIVIIICYIIYLLKVLIDEKNRELQIKKYNTKKKCLVVGYINFNLGDDLFFKILFERYPEIIFYMNPPSTQLEEYKKAFKKYKNIEFYDKDPEFLILKDKINNDEIELNIFDIICKKAKLADFYVNIGGSIFIQNDNWKNDDRFKLKEILENKPSFILGCNFGPGNEEFYEYYKEWFKHFDDICFRDKKSYNQFKELKNVRLADDIVLIQSKKSLFKSLNYRNNLGISVVNPLITNKLKNQVDDYYGFIVSCINFYCKKGFNITLFSFCKRERDLEAINEILKKLDSKTKTKIKVVSYEGNMKNVLNEWKKNKYIIGTRFHANILAISYNQHFLPIAYSDKTYDYLRNLDAEIGIYTLKELKRMKKSKLNFNNIKTNNTSKQQFMVLDNYINKK